MRRLRGAWRSIAGGTGAVLLLAAALVALCAVAAELPATPGAVPDAGSPPGAETVAAPSPEAEGGPARAAPGESSVPWAGFERPPEGCSATDVDNEACFPTFDEGSLAQGDVARDLPARPASARLDSLAPFPIEKDVIRSAHMGPDGKLYAETKGRTAPLTIVPTLQAKAEELMRSYQVPFGAVVALEPSTGRVLAMAEYAHKRPGPLGLCLRAMFPAASVFKLVTSAALIEEGVAPDESACYHGGKRRLNPKVLADTQHDRRCATFSQALGHSTNVVFARLAQKYLEAKELKSFARKLGFNRLIPFEMPVEVSDAEIPDDPYGMAVAAAGFGKVFLSPLHAALLAAAVANHGASRAPRLFEDQEMGEPTQVMSVEAANLLANMMELTVSEGTARRAFRERGRPVLGSIAVAGKTGSLADYKPFRDYSWFVGFAPKENPTIAIATLAVNGLFWKVRAPVLARELLKLYFEPEMKKAGARTRPVVRGRLAHR